MRSPARAGAPTSGRERAILDDEGLLRIFDERGAIIETFDKAVLAHYDAADVARGFIRSKDRQGNDKVFPVTSISIAVVTNLARRLDNAIQVGEKAAELKEHAKSLPGSLYVVDRRRDDEAARGEAVAGGRSSAAGG